MSDAKRVKWGILGTANIGRQAVIPAIQKSRNGIVDAVASRLLESAQALADELDIPRALDGYKALIDDPDVEAVYNPLPNHLHKPLTIQALEAGKHVLCEKPFAMNAAEAQDMLDAARQNDRVLMEAAMWRFHPRSQHIRQMVREGELGDVRIIQAAFCFKHPDPDDIRFKPEMGGGALLDVGFYTLNVARFMLDAEPLEVQAAAVYGETGIDLTTTGIMRFPGDILATFECSFDSMLGQTYVISGSDAAVEAPHPAFSLGDQDVTFIRRVARDDEGEVRTIAGVDEYQLMVEHFADVVRGDDQLNFPPEDSVANMRVLDALAESARSGHPVSLTA